MTSNRRDIMGKIVRGELNDCVELDLSNCNLSRFPNEVFQLKESLEMLNLGDNSISEIPNEIVCLRKLRILFFANNLFTSIPEILGSMESLRMLSFKSNKIKSLLPESIPPNLEWLILTNNRIDKLPNSVRKLVNLKKLMLSGNELTKLPPELINCESIELVRLSANKIENIPSWFLESPKLSWIALSGNNIEELKKSVIIDSPLLEVSWTNLEIKETLGSGASGVVSKAQLLQDITAYDGTLIAESGTDVAVKVFKSGITSDGIPADEMLIASAVGSHPHIQSCIATTVSGGNQPALLFKLIDPTFRSLGNPPSFESITRDTYPESTSFTIPFMLSVLTGIASALVRLAELGIMHGDLYAHNILVNHIGYPILGDFGAAFAYDKNAPRSYMFEKIEVRAYGCLIDDLLNHKERNISDMNGGCTAVDVEERVVRSLEVLRDECMDPSLQSRPNFIEISDRLHNIREQFENPPQEMIAEPLPPAPALEVQVEDEGDVDDEEEESEVALTARPRSKSWFAKPILTAGAIAAVAATVVLARSSLRK